MENQQKDKDPDAFFNMKSFSNAPTRNLGHSSDNHKIQLEKHADSVSPMNAKSTIDRLSDKILSTR